MLLSATRAVLRPAPPARSVARRWKGGGGAGWGRSSSRDVETTIRRFAPRPGYRLCRVCGIKDHSFTVKAPPSNKWMSWGQLSDAPVGPCEQKGVMCERAAKHKRQARRDHLIAVPVCLLAGFGYLMTFHRKAAPEAQKRIKAMRDDSEVAAEAVRAWCDGEEEDGNQEYYFASRMAAASTLSGAWTAHYTERGSKGTSAYSLEFAPSDQDAGTSSLDTILFEGLGKDCDGLFAVEGGRFNMSTRRLAWGERSQNSSLFARCQMECANEDCTKLQGEYLATTGIGGSLMMEWKAKNKTNEKHGGIDRLPVSDTEWV